MPIMDKGFIFGIESIQAAAVGRNPENTRLLGKLVNGANVIVAQAVRILGIVPIIRKSLRGAIEFVQPAAVSANPQRAGAILIDGPNVIVAHRAGSLLPESREFITIEAAQPVTCGKPEKPPAVLQDAPHEIAGKPIFDGQMLEFYRPRLRLQRRGRIEYEKE